MAENTIDLVQQAGFIFAGTVQELRASTIQHLSRDRCAVIQVNSTIDAPPILDSWVGRDITIGLRTPEDVKVGESAIFFAGSWVYGEGLALREVGRWPLNQDISHVRRQIVEARKRLADEDLHWRLRSAAIVVVGKVAQVADAAADEEGGPEREHDPQWLEAVIPVEIVLRGNRDTKTVVVLFAGSRDIAWRDAPKLHVGQRGVWILHETKIHKGERKAFVLDDSRDSRGLEELARIQALLHDTS